MTGFIALEGTARLAKEQREGLLKTLPEELLDEAEGFLKYLTKVPEAAVAITSKVSGMHDLSEGGIFRALWEVAERSGVGLCVDL